MDNDNRSTVQPRRHRTASLCPQRTQVYLPYSSSQPTYTQVLTTPPPHTAPDLPLCPLHPTKLCPLTPTLPPAATRMAHNNPVSTLGANNQAASFNPTTAKAFLPTPLFPPFKQPPSRSDGYRKHDHTPTFLLYSSFSPTLLHLPRLPTIPKGMTAASVAFAKVMSSDFASTHTRVRSVPEWVTLITRPRRKDGVSTSNSGPSHHPISHCNSTNRITITLCNALLLPFPTALHHNFTMPTFLSTKVVKLIGISVIKSQLSKTCLKAPTPLHHHLYPRIWRGQTVLPVSSQEKKIILPKLTDCTRALSCHCQETLRLSSRSTKLRTW